MQSTIVPFTIGLILGGIDVVPMVMKKIDRHATLSAFLFHLIMPFILSNSTLKMSFVLTGGIFYVVCTIPLAVLARKGDKKAPIIMIITSFVLGLACHFSLQLFLNDIQLS